MRPAPLSLRSLLFRLHWALGLTAGLVLTLVGLTGALMSYEEAIVAFANGDRAAVAAREAHQALTPAALATRIEAQAPGQRVASLTLSRDPERSAIARFAKDKSGERPVSVYADPTDGSVLGSMRLEEAFATIRALHRWLLLPGEGKGWGRTITGACTIALLVFLGTGLYLRWPGRHGWRVWLKPALARPGRARWWSLHAVAGTWVIPLYAVIALSGLWWSYDGYRAAATWILTGERPDNGPAERQARRKPAETAPRPPSTVVDTAWADFSSRHEAALAILTLPAPDAATIRIRWYAADKGATVLRNEATYDAGTGAIVSDRRSDDAALGRSMADNMLEVHRGRFFGPFGTVLFCLAALALPGFAATGLMLYLLRRRAGRRRVPNASPRPATVASQG